MLNNVEVKKWVFLFMVVVICLPPLTFLGMVQNAVAAPVSPKFDTSPANLAFGKPVTSSVPGSGIHSCEAVVNGRSLYPSDAEWYFDSTNGYDLPQWIQIDLGDYYLVDTIDTLHAAYQTWNRYARPKDLLIEFSDGTKVQITRASVNGYTWCRNTFPPHKTRWVKIWILSTEVSGGEVYPSTTGFDEINIYGSEQSPPPPPSPENTIGAITLLGGQLNRTLLSTNNRTVRVDTRATLEGTIQVRCKNRMRSSSVAPLCYTWTWGDRTKSIGLVDDWIPSGISDWNIPIQLVAPEREGDYWIIIAFNGEYTAEQICSCTNWPVEGNPIWYDGNDIWDWDNDTIAMANSMGAALVDYLTAEGMKQYWVPATGIKIQVRAPETPPTPSPSPTPSGVPFTDITPSFWAYNACVSLYAQGILQGYPDLTARPMDPLSRAEFVTFLCRLANIQEFRPSIPTFPDVPKPLWYYGYVEAAYRAGLVIGFPDGLFHPLEPVSRIQVITVLVRYKGWSLIYPNPPTFQDLPGNHWGFPFAEAARDHGMITKPDNPPHIVTEDGRIMPDEPALREFIWMLLYRLS